MNLTLIIQVDKFEDLSSAMDKITEDIKGDFNIMGAKSNACGVTEEGFRFDYQVDDSNHKSLWAFVSEMK